MTDRIERTALAAAKYFSAEHGPSLETDVLVALNPERTRDQYVDPISLASLIVSVATLGWTIYKDQRPSKDVLARRIRLELPPVDDTRQRDRVIDIVVDDVVDGIAEEAEDDQE